MRRLFLAIAALHCASATPTVPQPSQVTIDLSLDNAVNRVSPLMNGGHFSPLNHQVQVLYANMIFDESFEQTTMNPAADPRKYGDYQNHSWVNASTGDLNYVVEPPCASPEGANASCAFNGNASLRLTAGVGAGGVLNRGLYKQGFAFGASTHYAGYLFVRSAAAVVLKVSLADDGEELVAQTLRFAGGNWTRLNFSLAAPRATRCVSFPANTPPLWCGCSAEECDTCVRCGGELAITLVSSGAAADLDFVWLSLADEAELVQTSDPRRRRSGEMLALPLRIAKNMGHRMLRFGGTFSKCLNWKNFRGPAFLRQPYDDGVQSHGGSTRGVGVLEVQVRDKSESSTLLCCCVPWC